MAEYKFSPSSPFIGKAILGGKTRTVVSFELPNSDTTKVSNNDTIHNILLLDRSGSMSRDIDNLIEDVKKVVKVVNEDDYLTIIWFSGENEFRTVVKCSKNSSDDVCKILDTLKSTVGCTCFSQPLDEVGHIIDETGAISDVINVTVFTDGMPVTSWGSDEEESRIMKILDQIISKNTGKMITINTIGYGDYYNRDLMKAMSDKSEHGCMTHASDISNYSTIVLRDREIIKDLVGKRVKIVSDGCDIISQSFNNSKLLRDKAAVRLTKRLNLVHLIFDEDLDKVSYIVDGESYSATCKSKFSMATLDDVMYHYAYQLFYNGRRSDGTNVLNFLGNKKLLDDALSSFTASEVGDFINMLRGCAFNTVERPTKKFKRNTYIADESDVTVVDILNYLVEVDAKYKPNKQYKRVGKIVVDKNDLFTADKDDSWCPMSSIVLNKDRLNVSIKFAVNGVVEINKDQATRVGLDTRIPAHIFRTHTIIKDGSLNMKTLNVRLRAEDIDPENPVFCAIKKFYNEDQDLFKINLGKFRTVSKSNELEVDELYAEEVKLLEAEATNKVINYLIKNYNDLRKTVAPTNATFTPEQWDVLMAHGLNKSMTYQPTSRESVAGTDSYVVREVRTDIKGFASLPSVDKVLDKVKSGKTLTPSESLIYKKYMIYCPAENDIATLENARVVNKTVINTSRLAVSSAKLIRSLTGNPWFTSTDTDKFFYSAPGSEYVLVVNYVRTTVTI